MGETGAVGMPDDLGALVADHFNPVARKIAALPIPVVSAVRGLAAGAGCSLALHADFVIAGKKAYFLLAFINIGLVPDAGSTWLFAKAMGRPRATEMAMLGERLYAERAEALGLIYRAVEDDAVLDEARALAQRLARGPTLAFGLIRQSIAAALAGTLEQVLEIEARDARITGFSADGREGIAAFVEKRPAHFRGH
jgi:2-(1,2-epoxy-1,2-dihydrophenyl)acetyl-CoA isomerase